MFNPDFYPTPPDVIEIMLQGEDIENKIILEPNGGKGDIVDLLKASGVKSVISCEISDDLRKILQGKCKILANDFLTVTSDQISHVNFIVMNPPFSKGEKHILHAYNIAPVGCKIISLCNYNTISNPYSKDREELIGIIDAYGYSENLGSCFDNSERKTNVEIGLIKIQKPQSETKNEFEGFYLDEEPKEEGEIGIMPYNVIRDLVTRYIQAVKIFDDQLILGVKMNDTISSFFSSEIGFQCTKKDSLITKNEFKKDLQKEGWKFIFNKLDLHKYATKGLREDINKFIETQENIPFTMKNIYKMLEIINGTQASRMDKSILEVFENLTLHYDENRYNVEGWKTNSHYLCNKKFILPNMCYQDQRWDKGKSKISTNFGGYFDFIEDLMKALCYLTAESYNKFGSLRDSIRYPYKTITNNCVFYHTDYAGHIEKKKELYEIGVPCEMLHDDPIYGSWFDWGYFRCKAFKKGTMHFEFKSEDLWTKFNQRVAKLKGYPLYEHNKKQK